MRGIAFPLVKRWASFAFDGNKWSGVVDTPAKFKELLVTYGGDLAFLMDHARRAPVEELTRLPPGYHLGEARRTRVGQIPSFGLRREHTGHQTLGEWLRDNRVDLSEATPQ